MRYTHNLHFYKRKALTALFCCVTMLLAFPLNAAAINDDYMSSKKWEKSPNVTTVSVNCESLGNELSGTFSFFCDDKLCVYTCFVINETTLTKDADFVSVIYSFTMPEDGKEEYRVAVDKTGLMEGNDAEAGDVFEVNSNFDTLGTYISAAQYTGKAYKSCAVNVTLNVNGHNYRITENNNVYGKAINMAIPATVKTTAAKKPTSAKATAAKTTAKATTQKAYAGKKKTTEKAAAATTSAAQSRTSGYTTAAAKSSTSGSTARNYTTAAAAHSQAAASPQTAATTKAATTAKPTKFTPKQKYSTEDETQTEAAERAAEVITEGEAESGLTAVEAAGTQSESGDVTTVQKAKMNGVAKWFLLFGIGLAIAGITVLITVAVLKGKDEEENKNDEKEKEE